MEGLFGGFIFGLGFWLSLVCIALIISLVGLIVLFISYLAGNGKKEKKAEQPPVPVDLPDGVYFSSVFENQESSKR